MDATTIGLDIAKSVFHVHVADCNGRTILSRKLRRSQVKAFFAKLPKCVVGMEACGSAHHWGRIIAVLGHEVRLIPAAGACPGRAFRPDPGSNPMSDATRPMRAMPRRSARQ